MEIILEVETTWPGEKSVLGLKDGFLVSPEKLQDPLVVDFAGKNPVATPAWINAHAHLELSATEPINFDGDMASWLRSVVEFKQSLSPEEITVNYKQWANKLLASGTGRVVDHCDRVDLILPAIQELPSEIWLCKELIGFSERQILKQQEVAWSFCQQLRDSDVPGGLAPHAPYSAHPDLYGFVDTPGPPGKRVVSSHFHETQAEIEFARKSSGTFMELLEERDAPIRDSPYPGTPLATLLKDKVISEPLFGIHLNYLDGEDYRWLEASPICPVFCPNSYHHFHHDTLPVLEWFARDISFALGTDSRCSNRQLDMLKELRTLQELAPEIDSGTVLEALTVNPARVLGIPEAAVFAPGTPADISLFDVPSGEVEALARGEAEGLGVFLNGECLWSADQNLNSIYF